MFDVVGFKATAGDCDLSVADVAIRLDGCRNVGFLVAAAPAAGRV